MKLVKVKVSLENGAAGPFIKLDPAKVSLELGDYFQWAFDPATMPYPVSIDGSSGPFGPAPGAIGQAWGPGTGEPPPPAAIPCPALCAIRANRSWKYTVCACHPAGSIFATGSFSVKRVASAKKRATKRPK